MYYRRLKNNPKLKARVTRIWSKQQKGLCAICKVKKKLVIDHNHFTDLVRGLVCERCNFFLSAFDNGLQKNLREYLHKHELAFREDFTERRIYFPLSGSSFRVDPNCPYEV